MLRVAAADEEREFTAYGKTWVKALKLLREDGAIVDQKRILNQRGGDRRAVDETRCIPLRLSDREVDQRSPQVEASMEENATFMEVVSE